MRAIAIIPARYDSTRFKGKPLADLCGQHFGTAWQEGAAWNMD